MRISTDFVDNYDSSPPNSALSNAESYTSEASFCSTASSSWDSSTSTMSSSPPENSTMFPMTPVAMFDMEEHGIPYMTPVTNSMSNHTAAAEYEYNSMEAMYHPMVEVPELINNTPIGFYDHSSSPLTATPPHTQGHFVIPSHTLHDVYNASPCRPSGIPFESPLGGNVSLNTSPSVKYFLSPDGVSPSKPQSHQFKSLPQSVLDASSALHRLEAAPRVRKSSKKGNSGCDVVHIPKSVYKCTYPGCSEKDGKPRRFKRQEHLKRHMRIHTGGAKQTCQFCSKGFDIERSDNYRQHLKLHAEPEKKGKRTRYNAEAALLLEQFQREKVEGRQAKLQEAISMKDKTAKNESRDEVTNNMMR